MAKKCQGLVVMGRRLRGMSDEYCWGLGYEDMQNVQGET